MEKATVNGVSKTTVHPGKTQTIPRLFSPFHFGNNLRNRAIVTFSPGQRCPHAYNAEQYKNLKVVPTDQPNCL
jgi:hypothetical protein